MNEKTPATSVAPAFVLGVCLAVGLILAGYFMAGAVMEARKGDRSVTVVGSAETEVEATKGIWTLDYVVQAPDLNALGQALLSANARLLAFALEQGFSEIEIAELAPAVTRSADAGAAVWSALGGVRVTTSSPEKITAALPSTNNLVSQGIALQAGVSEPEFHFAYPEETLTALFREANQSAQRAAARFGDQTGQAVGAMRHAEQAPLEILPSPVVGTGRQLLRATTTAEFLLR
jgi:hypothetical protein